jgi:exopolyphosphatase/guanosine-5'-triphosphate,3'-diphosphate pyrophosphatase
MALLLRLAAALDRRPAPQLAWLKIQIQGVRGENPTGFTVSLGANPGQPGEIAADLSLERWSLASCTPVVLEATGLEMDVSVASSPIPDPARPFREPA